MALPDEACVVLRVARRPYCTAFERLWGPASFVINWPADAEASCDRPADAQGVEVVTLSGADRRRVALTYGRLARSIAAYERSADVSPFASRFDAYLDGRGTLTAPELRGLVAFDGKGGCSSCHPVGAPRPLLTGFGAANLGADSDSIRPGIPA